jgi:hypothetical protein
LDRLFSQYFCFPLSVSFHQCSMLIFIYMLLFQMGKREKPENLPKSNVLHETGEHWIEIAFT